jgi:ATP-dependent Lon protease
LPPKDKSCSSCQGSEKFSTAVRKRLNIFPLLPLRDVVIFPYMIAPLLVGRRMSINAVDMAWRKKGKRIVLVTQRNPSTEILREEDLYKIGTLCKILQLVKIEDGSFKILVEGLRRVKIESFLYSSLKEEDRKNLFTVKVSYEEEKEKSTTDIEALVRIVKNEFKRYLKLNPKISIDYVNSVRQIEEVGKLADIVVSHLSIKTETKQKLLEMFSPSLRLEKTHELLKTEIEVMKVEEKIHGRVKEKIRKTQKEYYLQEQMKAIQKELGKEEDPEISSLKEKIRKSAMPKEVEKKALDEVDKLSKMMSISPEATVIRNYVEWLVSMPWSRETKDKLDTKRAAKILDEDHYGLEKVKERVLEYLAVRKLVKSPKGPILCFVGPPGVGKTSIAKSIARALGRKFVRISLGGVRDEAEIRGHRRTYIGALPGKIIQSMKKADSKNPVFLLDEVDKMSMDFRGDPSSALLEVLDPEQNLQFNDHYLDVDFDLSKVMFITTANTSYAIPPSLLDRMETIDFDGYSEEEKRQIALKFLMPKLKKAHGFKKDEISISDKAFNKIIRDYTREAGVRNLERELASVLRKMARKKVEKKRDTKFVVTEKMIEKLLLPPRYRHLIAEEKDEVGVAVGLAVSETGGEILPVEATIMEGKGKLVLTGQLGEVMQESAQASLSYLRSHKEKLGLKKNFYKNIDIHVHVPEGAIPKDGPSAGIAMLIAMASALSKKRVKKKVAMTGEITLRGKVLPVGGIKGKVLAGHRDGIKTVILPKENEKDLSGIPSYVKRKIDFLLVEEIDQVLDKVFING